MATLLDVRDLEAYYGPTRALKKISFSLAEGGITALLGANGAGKTTTLRALCGMVRRSGTILFDGKPIDKHVTEGVVRLGVAHVPEGRGTFTALSVEENLRIAAYTRRDKAGVAQDLARLWLLSAPERAHRPTSRNAVGWRTADAGHRACAHAAAASDVAG
jgi:branched-chain amino acid transport system ATP-binding protein